MQGLNPMAIESFTSEMEYEAQILIKSLYEQGGNGEFPINPVRYTCRFTLKSVSFCYTVLFKLTWKHSNMLMISFGMRANLSDPLISKTLELAMEFMALTGQYSHSYISSAEGSKIMIGALANVVDFIKPLQWIPTSKRTRAQKLHNGFIEVYGSMIQRFQNLMNSGEEVPDCMIKTLLESQEEEKLDWKDLCTLAAVFTIGGVHSVSGTLSCILMMISYPQEFLRRRKALSNGFSL
jgi:hypothetical protein